MKKETTFKPPRKKCLNCGGKAWFPHPILEQIGCQCCDATGEGKIDIDALVLDWQRLKSLEERKKL